jgi:hypothetical protein
LRGDERGLYPREIAQELDKKNIRSLLLKMVEDGELTRENARYSLSVAFKAKTAFTACTPCTTDGPTRENKGQNGVHDPVHAVPDGPGTDQMRTPGVHGKNPGVYSYPPERNRPIVHEVHGVHGSERDTHDAWLEAGDPDAY